MTGFLDDRGRRAGAIWVADAYHGVLLRIDPRA
jgi:hypothetical protein